MLSRNFSSINFGQAIGMCLVVIYPFLYVWQGLDLTDMGYWLVGYQQFDSAPEVLSGAILLWLTYFIGHTVGLVVGDNIFSYRVAWAVIFSLTSLIAFFALRVKFKRNLLVYLIGTCALFVTVRKVGTWIDYNNLTMLAMVVVAIAAYNAVLDNSKTYLRVAAFVAGASVFIRLPNLAAFGFLFVLFIYWSGSKVSRKELLVLVVNWVVFYAMGVLAVLLAIRNYGHWPAFVESWALLKNVAEDSHRRHSLGNLISVFVVDYGKSIAYGLFLLAGLVYLGKKSERLNLTLQTSLSLVVGAALAISLQGFLPWKYVVNGICLVLSCFLIFEEYNKNRELALLAALSLVVLLVVPLGSSMSVKNSPMGMALIFPLVFYWLCTKDGSPIFGVYISSRIGRLVVITITSAVVLNSIYTSLTYTYRDTNNRISMRYQINNAVGQCVFTTAERVREIDEVVGQLNLILRPGEELLAYHNIPLIHYITRTKPWLQNPWPKTLGMARVKKQIAINFEKKRTLPVVVRDIADVSNTQWPSAIREPERDDVRSLLDDFVESNSYKVLWKNDSFEILVP